MIRRTKRFRRNLFRLSNIAPWLIAILGMARTMKAMKLTGG
jgi:hypothetical protein